MGWESSHASSVLAVCCLFLAGCGNSPDPTPTPNPTPNPTPGPTPSPSPTPDPSPTPFPSFCPSTQKTCPTASPRLNSGPSDRLGSFLAVGDWGHDPLVHGNCVTQVCQSLISQKMDQTMAELGDVKFVVNVGDSFYPMGLTGKDDEQWNSKWRDMYTPALRSVPWYSVYGNHDYHQDPGVCSDTIADGAQINDDIDNLDYFYMPKYNWYKEHPELDLEVVGLDLNNYMNMWKQQYPASQHNFSDCRYTACEDDCYSRIKNRATEGLELFKQRANATSAKNMIVFSHYPTDYFWDTSPGDPSNDFLAGLSNAPSHVTYFGGHRHDTDQDSTCPIGCQTRWLVGGGGGWSCDGDQQGFVVGEIALDGTLTTRSVLVDAGECCDLSMEV